MILLPRLTTSGEPAPIMVQKSNITEMSIKDENSSWIKYWNGSEIRSMVVTENIYHLQRRLEND